MVLVPPKLGRQAVASSTTPATSISRLGIEPSKPVEVPSISSPSHPEDSLTTARAPVTHLGTFLTHRLFGPCARHSFRTTAAGIAGGHSGPAERREHGNRASTGPWRLRYRSEVRVEDSIAAMRRSRPTAFADRAVMAVVERDRHLRRELDPQWRAFRGQAARDAGIVGDRTECVDESVGVTSEAGRDRSRPAVSATIEVDSRTSPPAIRATS